MIHLTQDPKYVIIDNRLCNAATNKPIPMDEPIFIFRAQDGKAGKYINRYAMDCDNNHHSEVVSGRAGDFRQFGIDHPERVKEPDTEGL